MTNHAMAIVLRRVASALNDAAAQIDTLAEVERPQIDTVSRPISDTKEWLTVAEVAPLLGVSSGLVYEMIRTGKIPSRRFGRLVRIPNGALQQMRNATS